MNKERRLKRVLVNENQILKLFNVPWFIEDDDVYCFTVSRLEGLPDDYTVIAVHYDFSYATWALVIESKEYDPVLIGDVIPILK